MAGIFRKLTKQFFITVNLVVSASILLLWLLPYSNQSYFWILNLFALVLPYLLLLQVVFIIFWLIAKPRLVWIPLFTFLLSWGLVDSLVSFHSPEQEQALQPGQFRVASWNVHLFDFYENGGRLDPKMIRKAKSLAADILCVQELVFSKDTTSPMSLQRVTRQLGFQYAVTGDDRAFGVHTNINTKNEKYFPFCLAIFSNYPIIRWQKVQSLKEYNHTFIWADVVMGSDTLRVFNVHLQSMHFVKNDYDFIENIDRADVDVVKRQGRNILRKIRNANFQRSIQAQDVKRELQNSPYPVLLMGDFNDVPNSYAYQVIGKGLGDAFAEKGWLLGRTFQFLSPTLRLDYIFYSQPLQPVRYHEYEWDLSDHLPVTTVFERN